MDNKEFARLLLCEATELLESTGRNGLARRIYEEKYGKEDPKSDLTSKELELDAENRRLLSKENKDNISAKMAKKQYVNGKYMPSSKLPVYKNDRAKEINKLMSKYHDITYKNYKNASRVNKNINLKSKINKNKERINTISKTQNESIAILLTEAALLLNNED